MITVWTDDQMDFLIENYGSKTIEMPLIKVQNMNAQIAELKKERRKLKRENAKLQRDVDRLIAEQLMRGEGQVVSNLDLDRELKLLIARFHPDKNPENQLAHEVTVALNKLREEIAK